MKREYKATMFRTEDKGNKTTFKTLRGGRNEVITAMLDLRHDFKVFIPCALRRPRLAGWRVQP